jgi:hypothetical protein
VAVSAQDELEQLKEESCLVAEDEVDEKESVTEPEAVPEGTVIVSISAQLFLFDPPSGAFTLQAESVDVILSEVASFTCKPLFFFLYLALNIYV